MISQHLDKNNLHHAYLIEGRSDEIIPEIVKFFKDLGVKTVGSSDFIQINLDSFKIEDARNLKSYGNQKGFSADKKIFIISANNFLLDAQNSLLKMFEEPIENTHFFLIVPDVNILLKTFISRFYLISTKSESTEEYKMAEKFIAMPLSQRIDFMKELLVEPEGEDVPTEVGIPTGVGKEIEIIPLDSARSKSLKFLDALELVLHDKLPKFHKDISFFGQIFKVREYLRMPGSSTKTLMESVALSVPSF